MSAFPLLKHLEKLRLSAPEVARRQHLIYRTLLEESSVIDAGNFTQFHAGDLRRLFELYDDLFFEGSCREQLGIIPLQFRISSRMTSAGGKTTRFARVGGDFNQRKYEITVSSTLLFQTFRDVRRPVKVTGILCKNRLEALQRIFEHELVHLVEMLLWDDSNCSARRFQSIAEGRFGHKEHRHALVTPQERAQTQFGLKPGGRVQFTLEGAVYTGVVSRITKRATVLVEDRRGQRYSDGKKYLKFYVPFEMLQPVAP